MHLNQIKDKIATSLKIHKISNSVQAIPLNDTIPHYLKTIWQYEDQLWCFWHYGKKIGGFTTIKDPKTGEIRYKYYKAIYAWAYVVEYFYSFHQTHTELTNQILHKSSEPKIRIHCLIE
ncbi:MAG: hypothetical protein HOP11_10780 [Saprospiraceae bacterium]|nr:hypothetical protein [Saprospiraceae bacterium]